jgi:hypothetical protein
MVVVVSVLTGLLVFWLVRKLGTGRQRPLPHAVRWPLVARSILSPREQALFQQLVELYPEHVVLAQVALSQLIDVRETARNRRVLRNRFSQLVADFVLCTRDFSIVAVIELDDTSHARSVRADADARKAIAVASAGLRMVRIDSGPLPAAVDLRRLLEGGGEDTGVVSAAAPAPVVPAPVTPAGGTPPWLRPAFAGGGVALAVCCGWLWYSHAYPVRMVEPAPAPRAAAKLQSQAVVSLAEIPVVDVAEQAKRSRLAAQKAAAAQQAAVALEKRKERAWAAFFKPDDNCEHPVEWADQVECGNQYIRAKKAFEKQWRSQQSRPAAVESLGQNLSP